MVRVKKRWNQSTKLRTAPQMANAIGATIWKLSANVVLNLENENFETSSLIHRIEVMEELVCYLIHVCDRWIFTRTDQVKRTEFLSALANDMARMLADSRSDVQGNGDYQEAFLGKLNQRAADYSSFRFDADDRGGFAIRCRLGDRVRDTMGTRDQRWIPDYIIGREAPEIESALLYALSGLVKFDNQQLP